jgi:anti-sigma B factor antagonist
MSAAQSSPYRPFGISVVRSQGEVVVIPVGDVDLASADILRHEVEKVPGAGVAQVVVDLTKVDFIDSVGLRALLSLRNDANQNGHALTLVAPGPTARRIFEVTGTRGLFDWRVDRTSPSRFRFRFRLDSSIPETYGMGV